MVNQVTNGEQTFLDLNGDPLSGGLVYMYTPGTTNFSTTWSDSMGTIPNTNPIVLDQAGRATIWGIGSYRQVVTDQFGTVQWDQITTAGLTGPVSGNIPGNLTVGGSGTIAGNLTVNGFFFANQGGTFGGQLNGTSIYLSGVLATNTITSNGNPTVAFDAPGQFGNIIVNQGGVGVIAGVSNLQSAAVQSNDIYTDHIHAYSVGSITIDDPVYFNGTSGISISSGNNIAGVNDLSAANLTASNAVFTNLLACNGASFVTVNCGLITNTGDIQAQSTFQPTVSMFNDTSGTGFGICNAGSVLAFGTANSAGAFTGQLMSMDAGGNLSVDGAITAGGNINTSGDLNVASGVISGSNIIPTADNTGSVGQSGQRWQIVTGYDAIFQNYITGSTDQASPQQAIACLPLVESINVKTAPHIGLAREDCANIPGAQITSGGVEGVSNNAIVACLWKALQELNAAFNAYVAAHP